MRNLIRISLLAFAGSFTFLSNAQEILTEEHPLKEVKSVIVVPHETHVQGMKLSRNENSMWSFDQDPTRISWDENTRVVTTIVDEIDGVSNYYIALVDDVPQTDLKDYKSRPLYYPADNFKVEAKLLVDSASMELSLYRDMYLKSFMNYLSVAERFEDSALENYWKNQFYLFPEDSMYFNSEQIDGDIFKETIYSIFPYATVVKSSKKKEAVKDNGRNVKMKRVDPESKAEFNSKEEMIAAKGLPLYFISGKNALVVQVIPFVENGENKIQKYFLHKTQGVVHSSVRTLKPHQDPVFSGHDLRDFKVKPTEDQINAIKSGKGLK